MIKLIAIKFFGKRCKYCIFHSKDGYCGYYERKIKAEHKACENFERKEIR